MRFGTHAYLTGDIQTLEKVRIQRHVTKLVPELRHLVYIDILIIFNNPLVFNFPLYQMFSLGSVIIDLAHPSLPCTH